MADAARLGDDHSCPQTSGLMSPHKGGPIVAPGEPHVQIEGQAAARFTDTVTCVGALDAVAFGSPTVFIGGLLAARKGDESEHGGAITAGAETVKIGYGPMGISMVRRGKIWIIIDRVKHTITMNGLQEFSGPGASEEYARNATDTINTTWSGPTTIDGQPYEVVSQIQGRQRDSNAPENPSANQITVAHATESRDVLSNKDPAHQQLSGPRGYQHDNECDNGDVTAAHEFGHSMGIKDEYTENFRLPWQDRNLTRNSPPGSLMAYSEAGSKPTPANMKGLVDGTGVVHRPWF